MVPKEPETIGLMEMGILCNDLKKYCLCGLVFPSSVR